MGVLSLTLTARADEPRKVTEPRILRDPAEITNVVDAFDDDNPFDLHITLGFEQTWKRASIRRETSSSQPQFSSGGFTANNLEIGRYTENTSRLNTRMDVGLYKDVALILRLPVILSDDREIRATGTSGANQALNLEGVPGEQLFSLPFKSPTRSGIEYLAVGLDVGILNQWRDATKPTWIFGFEGRFSLGDPMHACNANPSAGQVHCADPSDIDRDGVASVAGQADQYTTDVSGKPVQLQGTNFHGGRKAGVSRGTTSLEVHSYVSKRLQYVEPYGGMNALFEFQNAGSDFGSSDLKGSLVNHPPLQGSMVLGMEIVPWEMFDKLQRLSLDLRFTGTYHSEGRDYSEVYDALGSSGAQSLRYPNFAQFKANPNYDPAKPDAAPASIVDTDSQRVYTTGITDVQAYGSYRFGASVTWQAGAYIKFDVGGSYTLTEEHVLTFDQPCNPDFTGNVAAAGTCLASGETTATGIPNPNYRSVIDTPGRRFRVASSTAFDAWVNATVMF